MKIYKGKKGNCFSTVELIVSISIIVILGGMLLLNYGLQRDKMALDSAVNATVQSIRKVQGLALGQLARPDGYTTPEGLPSFTKCSDVGKEATNFAILFKKDENKVHLVADKDMSGKECYFETRYFSPSIKIDTINPVSNNMGWVSFYRENLLVKINNNDANNNLEVTLCIKSSCSTNRKKITINKAGLVEVQ